MNRLGYVARVMVLGFCPALLTTSVSAQEAPAEQPKDAERVEINDACVLRFINREQAMPFLMVEDPFVQGLSRFDLRSRLKTDQDVTKADYLAMTAKHLLDWSPADIQRVSEILDKVKPKLAAYDLPFPEEIVLMKYSGKGEAGACYTRRNGIVFAQRVLAGPLPRLKHVVLHEIFHVLSRHDDDFRRELYGLIGFKPCDPIKLPNSLSDLKISNPDAPTIDYYIRLREPDSDESATIDYAVPVLLASEPFDPEKSQNFFEYMQFKLLAIRKTEQTWRPVIDGKTGKPHLIEPTENASYHRQIGRNTGYIIHPDEILADNFVFLVLERQDLPSPRIIQSMREKLERKTPDGQQ